MSFFYDLNKKLDGIRATPEVTHKQLNERDEGKPGKNFAKIAKDAGERYGSKAAGERVAGAVRNKLKAQGKLEEEGMSRAAKGYEKYGKQGMEALAKAGRDGKALDPIRKKYDKYDNKQVDEISDQTAYAVNQARAAQHFAAKDAADAAHKSWASGDNSNWKQNQAVGTTAQAARDAKSKLARNTELQKSRGDRLGKQMYEPATGQYASAPQSMGTADGGLTRMKTPAQQWNHNYEESAEMGEATANPAGQRRLRDAMQAVQEDGPEMLAYFAIAAMYGNKMWDNDAMGDLVYDLEQANPTEDELKYIIVNKALPTRLKNTRFTAGDDVQFGHLGEGPIDAIKKVGKKVASGVNKLVGHGSDEEMRKDLQRKSGAPVTGKKPTFADKIANAKKEVDEMLGDVAAEAIKTALSPKQKKIDMNKNGKLDANDFAMLRKGAKSKSSGEMDEEKSKGTAFDLSTPREVKPKVGSVERGHKHDIKHTATGRMVTRRTDDQGNSVGADDDSEASGEKRGRGRPKGTKQSIGAKGPSGKSKLMTKEGDQDITDQGEYDQEGDMAKDDIKTIVRHAQALSKVLGDNDNLPEWVQSKLAKIEGMMISIDEYMQNQQDDEEEPIAEKAVSKQQQKFMGMAHAMQKGEKIPGASKELKKVAKTMKKKDVEDFASTKHKGLPNKVKSKKKEEDVEESTTSGSVATSTASSGSKGGVFGKGIYDSMNRELEKMISESMSINMSDSTEGNKSLTVTATDDDAMKLAMILKSAGLGGQGSDMHSHDETCDTCGMTDCGCGDVQEAVDENAPDWPTNTETSNDALQYAGGLNKPKTDVAGDGQTTVPNTAVHTQDENMLHRLREMAGIKQAELEPWKETMKEQDEDFFHNPNVPADKQLPATPKEIDVELDEELEEDFLESIQRMREIAGIQEAKKAVDEEKTEEGNLFTKGLEDDNVKIGDKIPGTNAIKKKDIDESIFALTNQWQAYKG